MNCPELIVMLTCNDHTVTNAAEIFEQCKHSPVDYWGMKEDGLPLPQMRQLFAHMKELGKTTVLEVVAYSREECMAGAQMAADCGCDILMGTLFYDCVNDFCREKGIKYMPFVGNVTGRPSKLGGTLEEMLAQARSYLEKGVYGIDLLGYRYEDDPAQLIREFVAQVDAPVCVAGSINSYCRLQQVQNAGPWAYTIGGAFFENRFHGSFARQIENVLEYMQGAVHA